MIKIERPPAPGDIIELVAKFYNISTTDLLGRDRHQTLSLARQVAMYLTRKHTPMSLKEIGGIFGRYHTTILNNVREIWFKQDNDPSFRAHIELIEGDLNARAIQAA